MKKKFEELYFQSTAPDRVDRVFKIYRTTALDQKLVKKTFKLVDETLRRRNLFEAGLLWSQGNETSKNRSINALKSFEFLTSACCFFFYPRSHNLGVVILPVFSNSKKKNGKNFLVILLNSLVSRPSNFIFFIFFFTTIWQITISTWFIVCKWGDLAVNHIDSAPYALYIFLWWFINSSRIFTAFDG